MLQSHLRTGTINDIHAIIFTMPRKTYRIFSILYLLLGSQASPPPPPPFLGCQLAPAPPFAPPGVHPNSPPFEAPSAAASAAAFLLDNR